MTVFRRLIWAGAAVVVLAMIWIWIMGPFHRCARAGLEPWPAATSFCHDTRTGALYAPKFMRR